MARRSGLSALTYDALVDEAVGLHIERAALQRALKAGDAEAEDLRRQYAAATTDGLGTAIAGLHRRLDRAKRERNEAMRGAKVMEARMKAAVAKARRLENTPISMEGAR